MLVTYSVVNKLVTKISNRSPASETCHLHVFVSNTVILHLSSIFLTGEFLKENN